MNVFSFVQWNKYFHEVKDEMYHSTRLHLVEWNSFIFHLMKIFVPINIHYLYIISPHTLDEWMEPDIHSGADLGGSGPRLDPPLQVLSPFYVFIEFKTVS